MHTRNTRTHQDTSSDRSGGTHSLSAHHAQGNGQDERHHPNVVHGPNASSHRAGPAQQPNRASPTARGRYATCEIQSSVRRKHGNQHRKRRERVVVRANQVHGSHLTPSDCYAEQSPLSMSSASLRILPIGSVSMVIGEG